MEVGTRAWDGLLEALRANLISALLLRGMFSCAVSLAQPLPGCAPINAMQQTRLSGFAKWRERLVLRLVVAVGTARASASCGQ
jgi:hypothetical protein